MNTRAPTLLVLAAGMGSRYGGLKQCDPMGPTGETLLDYSVFDALRAGFGRVVFVIRRDFAEQFKQSVGRRYVGRIRVDYVFQDLDDLPNGFSVPPGRERPWGTLHAVLAARDVIEGAFAVINADDFYGRDAYCQAAAYFGQKSVVDGRGHYCMVGYPVGHTLSASGGVNRGICREADGLLVSVEEHTGIVSSNDGYCLGCNLKGEEVEFSAQAPSSMNFWGLTSDIFARMHGYFAGFLHEHAGDLRAECYIPSAIDSFIRAGEADCRILKTNGCWFGVTYPEDKPATVAKIGQLIAAGEYATDLWA